MVPAITSANCCNSRNTSHFSETCVNQRLPHMYVHSVGLITWRGVACLQHLRRPSLTCGTQVVPCHGMKTCFWGDSYPGVLFSATSVAASAHSGLQLQPLNRKVAGIRNLEAPTPLF